LVPYRRVLGLFLSVTYGGAAAEPLLDVVDRDHADHGGAVHDGQRAA
jgi:hypothetical protein